MASVLRSFPRLRLPSTLHSTRSLSSLSPSSPPPSSSSSTSIPTHHYITLLRSAIGLPKASLETLQALGLTKLHSTKLHPFSATTAGQILKVKELVAVKNVTEEEGMRLVKEAKSKGEGRGWEVVGSLKDVGRITR